MRDDRGDGGPAPTALSETEAWALLDTLRAIDGVRAVTVLPDPSGSALRVDLILDATAPRAHAATEAARLASTRLGRFVAVFVDGGTDVEPLPAPAPRRIAAPEPEPEFETAAEVDESDEVLEPEPAETELEPDDLLPVGSGRIAFGAAPTTALGHERRNGDDVRADRRRRDHSGPPVERRRRPRALVLDRVHLTPGDPGTEQAVVTLRHHGAVGVGTAPGTDAPSIAAATLQAIRVIVDGAVGPDAAADLAPVDVSDDAPTRVDAAAVDAPAADAATTDVARGRLRVLFVGNSYTYVNDLPGLVTRMGAAA